MKKLFILFLFLIPSTSFANEEINNSQDVNSYEVNDSIVIAGGRPTGIRFAMSGIICKIETEKSGRKCFSMPSGNSVETIRALQSGNADIAIVQSDWLYHARNGTSRFTEIGPDKTLKLLGVLNTESAIIITNKNSKIKSISDFKNKRIDFGENNTYRELVTKILLKEGNIKNKNIKKFNYSQDRSISKICDNSIDATIFVLPHPNNAIDLLTSQCNIEIMSIDIKTIENIKRKYKGIYQTKLKKNLYWNQEKEINTIGFHSVLISTSNSDIYSVLSIRDTLLKNIPNIAKKHATFFDFTKDLFFKKIGIPLHEAIINKEM